MSTPPRRTMRRSARGLVVVVVVAMAASLGLASVGFHWQGGNTEARGATAVGPNNSWNMNSGRGSMSRPHLAAYRWRPLYDAIWVQLMDPRPDILFLLLLGPTAVAPCPTEYPPCQRKPTEARPREAAKATTTPPTRPLADRRLVRRGGGDM